MVSAHFKVGDSVRCKASTYYGRPGVVSSIDYTDKLPRYIVTWQGGKAWELYIEISAGLAM